VILLDADVILIDRKFTTDVRHATNRAALDRMRADGHDIAMTAHAVLEVVGVLSYGSAAGVIPLIPAALRTAYRLRIIPDPTAEPSYALCTFDDLLAQMAARMSLGDAVQAVQIRMFAPTASALVTWNAKHFRGKLVVPVLTPEEWLLQQTPPAPPTAPAPPPPPGPTP
jgi:hypothetical protein